MRAAFAGLRARGGRTLISALGIFAASLVVGTAATVGYSLATGFDRAATQADLPDVVARFDAEPLATVRDRVAALPNLETASYRTEITNVGLSDTHGHRTRKGSLQLLLGGRPGYTIVAGRDLDPEVENEVVVERGLADTWGLKPGDLLQVGPRRRFAPNRVVGVAVAPDNVAYPLAKAARIYLGIPERFRRGVRPNVASLWLVDPGRADLTLTQARAVSFGLGKLQLVTRTGVEVLISQAAGIVIALLVAFSLVALVAAGTMLAAGASAEVARRLPAFGVQRALGFTPARLAARQAAEAAIVAVPAAVAGLALGALLIAGPAARLLAALNEIGPGAVLLGPLALCLAAIVAVVVAAATIPAWRAARRPPVQTLRGGDVHGGSGGFGGGGPGAGRTARGGRPGLGARFATAARARWLAAVATVAVCAGVVALMLALASLLERLREDPATLGKRYQLTAQADASAVPAIRRIPGVAGASARYAVEAADSFRLGEPLQLIGYPGDHTAFEAPPLASGRRVQRPGEVEVGLGLADALGLRPGSTLAAQLPSGSELRLRVVGVVRALDRDGRIAWVQSRSLLGADPTLAPQVAIRLAPGADRAAVVRALARLGATLGTTGAAQTDSRAFLGVLVVVLRGVGLAVGLVCLYALVQALTLTAVERRGAVALLRAVGGDGRSVAGLLGGAAAAVALPAAIAGIALEILVFGPLVARRAAGFAALPLSPTVGQVLLVAGGVLALAALATAVVCRRVLREPVVTGLRAP